ncbi:MAG: signal peptidase II [Stellaceae bacterium]
MWLGLAVAAIVAVADQAAKLWVLDFFAARPDQPPVLHLAPFFNLVLAGNRGMSFGLFNGAAGANTVVFTALAAVIVLGLIAWLRRVQGSLLQLAIGLVIGGAIGNVADRLHRGAVVDFLDFHLGGWHWFAFNLADAAICVGVAVLLIDGLIGRRRSG